MNILLVLVPLSLALVAFGVWAFFWAVGNGQFDDLAASSWEPLLDERPTTAHRSAAGRRQDG